MKIELHHINLSSHKVNEMNEFYLKVMQLKTETDGLPTLEKKKGYSGDVAFVSDGKIQTHSAEKDLNVCFRQIEQIIISSKKDSIQFHIIQ